jgi:hypothetical protein
MAFASWKGRRDGRSFLLWHMEQACPEEGVPLIVAAVRSL